MKDFRTELKIKCFVEKTSKSNTNICVDRSGARMKKAKCKCQHAQVPLSDAKDKTCFIFCLGVFVQTRKTISEANTEVDATLRKNVILWRVFHSPRRFGLENLIGKYVQPNSEYDFPCPVLTGIFISFDFRHKTW